MGTTQAVVGGKYLRRYSMPRVNILIVATRGIISF